MSFPSPLNKVPDFWQQLTQLPAGKTNQNPPSGLTLVSGQEGEKHAFGLAVSEGGATVTDLSSSNAFSFNKVQSRFAETDRAGLHVKFVHFASQPSSAEISPEQKRFADQFPEQAEQMRMKTAQNIEQKELAIQQERLDRQRALFGIIINAKKM